MPTARVNGLDIAYEEHGSGEPLLLISGIGMQLVAWPEGLIAKLVDRGFRVIVFDHRDVGLSTKTPASKVPRLEGLLARRLMRLPIAAPYSLFDMAADAAGLLDALGIRSAHVVGVSMGGMVAQALSITRPDRIKTLVSMMSHSGGRLFTGRPRAMLNLLRRPGSSRAAVIASYVRFFREAGSTDYFRDDAGIAARAGLAYDRNHHPSGFVCQMAAVLATGDLRARLRDVSVPTLVLHGTVDGIFRTACARETANAIPGARLVLIPGWGHDLAEGAWDFLVPAIADHAAGAPDADWRGNSRRPQ